MHNKLCLINSTIVKFEEERGWSDDTGVRNGIDALEHTDNIRGLLGIGKKSTPNGFWWKLLSRNEKAVKCPVGIYEGV